MSDEFEMPKGESVEQRQQREKREWGPWQLAALVAAAFFRIPVVLTCAWLLAATAFSILIWAVISNPVQSLIASGVSLMDPWSTRESFRQNLGFAWAGYWQYIPFAISVVSAVWLWTNRGILASHKRTAWILFGLLIGSVIFAVPPLGAPVVLAYPFLRLARFLRRRADGSRDEAWKLWRESDELIKTNWGDFPGWLRGGFPIQPWLYRVGEWSVVVLPLIGFSIFLLTQHIHGPGAQVPQNAQSDGMFSRVEGDVKAIVDGTSYSLIQLKFLAGGLVIVLLGSIADSVGWRVWRHMRDVQLPHWSENRTQLD